MIYEGVFLRYKPGMMRDPFIPRWCQVTKTSLKIYAGDSEYAHLDSLGLVEIPLSKLSHVCRVKYDIKASRSKAFTAAASS